MVGELYKKIFNEAVAAGQNNINYSKSTATANIVYHLLLESAEERKTQSKESKEKRTVFELLKKQKQRSTEPQTSMNVRDIERNLMQEKNLTISAFDTVYVFQKAQEKFTVKEQIPMYRQFFEELSDQQKYRIERAYWESLNEYIIDVARNIVASVKTRKKVLAMTPEVI